MKHHGCIRSKTCACEGFTLVEILITIGILTFGLLAVASMQVSAIRGNDFSSNVTEATVLAQDKLELLSTLPYAHSDLQDQDGDFSSGLADSGASADYSETPAAPFSRYTVSWNVSENNPVPDAKTIRVIITWHDRGIDRQIFMDSIKSS
jgi:type IV pilus assembly protein PilV